jgi:hypothetical protein
MDLHIHLRQGLMDMLDVLVGHLYEDSGEGER